MVIEREVVVTFHDAALLVSLLQAVAVVDHEDLTVCVSYSGLRGTHRVLSTYVVSGLDKTVVDHGLRLGKEDVGIVVALEDVPSWDSQSVSPRQCKASKGNGYC